MSRGEIAFWYIAFVSWVLIISTLILDSWEKLQAKKTKLRGAQPQVEVYKKVGSKFDKVG